MLIDIYICTNICTLYKHIYNTYVYEAMGVSTALINVLLNLWISTEGQRVDYTNIYISEVYIYKNMKVNKTGKSPLYIFSSEY